jgi:NAD(P)-dependent dehydrogenase (short-subunit alcohol dehydrogenase family)
VPDQGGRTAVVTGANSGIGFETARVLAEHGATVILACRDVARGEAAAARIGGPGPVATAHLDLGSLASVRAAAGEIHRRHQLLDLLINNAGLMMPPYGTTSDGFEQQFGTNHLGHFALTGLLLDLLLPTAGSRVVTVSSNMHRAGRLNFADLQSTQRYRRVAAYGQSKLANLLFSYELQRRLAAAGARTGALAAHPGTAITALTRYFPPAVDRAYHAMGQPIAQQPPAGALPTLRAATDPAARGGEYYGPDGWLEFKGYPHRVSSSARSHDEQAQRRLWQESERLTGVRYADI